MNLSQIRERAEELFRQGFSEVEIAEELDLPLRGIERALENLKLEVKKQEVIPLRKAGRTYAQITEITGLSSRTIWKVLAEAGMVNPRGPQKIDEEQKKEIKYRAFLGDHFAEIAKDYGVSTSYIYQIADGLSVDGRMIDGNTKLSIAQDFLVEGFSVPAIAMRRNVSLNTVYYHRFADPILNADWFKKHDLEFDSQKKYVFKDPKVSMEMYWAVWFAHNREKVPYKEIAERLNLTPYKVTDIAAVRTESAYRAVWEMRVKDRGYE